MLNKRIAALEAAQTRKQASNCGTCHGWGMVIYELGRPGSRPMPPDPDRCPECGARVAYKALRGVSMDDL